MHIFRVGLLPPAQPGHPELAVLVSENRMVRPEWQSPDDPGASIDSEQTQVLHVEHQVTVGQQPAAVDVVFRVVKQPGDIVLVGRVREKLFGIHDPPMQYFPVHAEQARLGPVTLVPRKHRSHQRNARLNALRMAADRSCLWITPGVAEIIEVFLHALIDPLPRGAQWFFEPIIWEKPQVADTDAVDKRQQGNTENEEQLGQSIVHWRGGIACCKECQIYRMVEQSCL